jgi:hypothetical protein
MMRKNKFQNKQKLIHYKKDHISLVRLNDTDNNNLLV